MDEEEFKKAVVTGLIPNRYDMIKIIVFAGIMFLAFFLGMMASEVRTCSFWMHDQLVSFNILQNDTIMPIICNNTSQFNFSERQ